MKIVGLLALCGGCFLPVATGAPEPATTVGKGHVGAMISGEAPTIDLIAKNGTSEYADTYGESPAAAMRFTLSFGLDDDTDLEVAAEGELWLFFLPLPTGGSVGLRHHLLAGDAIDFALAARVGGVSAGTEYTDSSGNRTKDDATAEYGAVQAVAQLREGFVRPLASVSFMPFNVHRTPGDMPETKFKGLASSVTFGLMLVGDRAQFGPYFTVTNFVSDQFAGGTFASGGLMLAIRPDRNRPHYAPAPPPYNAPPAPYPPPPPAPYPAP
ncbi:MAG: hypothetical protein ACM31C_26460 [Acidobacteriota bacterium]